MSDLREQLATYIDAIAEPVSPEEVRGRARAAERRPRRALVAAMAGAAVVLIPAFVLVALRGLPFDDGEVVTATTSPAVTTATMPAETAATVAPETAATASPVLVEVPDVVGLTAADATDLLTGAGFTVDAEGDPHDVALVASQDPVAGTSVAAGATIHIDIAPYTPACREGWEPELPPLAAGEQEVTVLFDCANETVRPNVVTPVVRRVPATADPIRATLDALLAGPTAEERAAGFGSFFSDDTAGALESLTLAGRLAVVDFGEGIYVDNASTSTGSEFFLAELGANLFQFDEIEQIEFRVDGRCEAFWNWLQRSCMIVTRDGRSPTSPFGSCSATGLEPPSLDPQRLPAEVHRTATTLASLASRCDLVSLDEAAVRDDTVLVWSHLGYGETPFWNSENGLVTGEPGRPAALLIEVLSDDHAVYADAEGLLVHVWPAVASPDFRWDELTDAEIEALVERYISDDVMFSIEADAWFGFSVEIEENGRWRSFSRGLT